MKYRAIFTHSDGFEEVIKVCDTKNEAIEVCVEHRIGYYSCDTKEERRIGLQERGWTIVGYSSNTLSVEEVTV